jgi:hypothetical protein
MMCDTPHEAAVMTRAVSQRAMTACRQFADAGLGRPLWPVGVSCGNWDTPDRTVMCGLLVARPGGACACLNRSVSVIVRLYTSLNTKNGR